jgi:asparagine synthase (glutamine-hydrolysing)
MCGIVGILYTDGAAAPCNVLSAMMDSLSHRGPDGEGSMVRDNVALGHRRLAIIDLQTGQQPICNEDGQVTVTFNGEIYNYRELAQELRSLGHIFRTNSDTEVIVHGWEQWGKNCVERFRGMFAFAIVDWREQVVFLARDHLGIKPLYYLQDLHRFAFASELQALHCLPDLQLDLDLQAIDQYLWLQYIPAPKTVFRQIRKLQPAHRMTVSFDGKVTGPEEYWQLEFRPNHSRTEAEWIEALDAVLRDSVRAHLVSDVPFGAFLSGGVDSSAVVAYMAQILDRPVRTFSIGFEETEFNELKYASQAAEKWETEHHVEIVRPNALEILPKLVSHYGEPFGDNSAIPTYYVSQMARRSVTMVLSGDGGDEAFAGYDSYRRWLQWLAYEGIPTPSWRQRLRPFAERLMPERYPPRQATLDSWLRFITFIPHYWRQKLWRDEYESLPMTSVEALENEFARTNGLSRCNVAQYLDIKSYLPYDILTKVDIASMIHSLEVRTPLTDVRVIEFAATIPETMNICKNGTGHWEGKRLFKKVMQKYYPSEFLHRPKMGFAMPIAKWFAPEGALRGNVRERLLGSGSALQDFFHPNAIQELLTRNAVGPLWVLLFLEEWLRQNKHDACRKTHPYCIART